MASCAVETKPSIPVGVFWDIENCCVPRFTSVLLLVQAIRQKVLDGNREAEFMCACDTSKESKKVIQELNQAQVNVVHVDAVSKNAADDKIRQNIRRFSDTHTPPSRIVLISSDVNFSSDLYDLRYRKHIDIVLVHGDHVHESLLLSAKECIPFHDLIKDVPNRICKDEDGPVELHVTGYKIEKNINSIKMRLRQLSSNTGGRVVRISESHAIIRFTSRHLAHRAQRRMEGQEVYGSAIQVSYPPPPLDQHYNNNNNGRYYNQKQNNAINNSLNVSPNRTRPYSQSYRRNQVAKETKQVMEVSPVEVESSEESSPIDTLLNGGVNGLEECEEHTDTGLQEVVKKFAQGNKSSRQQQIYQEEQVPLGGGNSTQFYSHYTKYQQTSYYDYHNQWHPQDYKQQNGYNGYYNQYNNYNNTYQPNGHYGNKAGFQPIRSASPSDSSCSSSPIDFNTDEFPGAVDLLVSNLDYNISPREWKSILMANFQPHIKILYLDVCLQPDNTSLGIIKVGTIDEARFAISQFHRKKIGYKRIHVTLRTDDNINTASTIRSEAIALLNEAKDNVLPLFKFIELFNKRFNRSVSVSELYKMNDTIEIHEQGGAGRMIHLAPALKKPTTEGDHEDNEVQEINEHVVCKYHCPEGSTMYGEAINTSILPNVKVHLKTFAPQLHFLLTTHNGDIPLMSFPACFNAEVGQLVYVYEGGVPLEHVITCVPGVQIVLSNTGVKKISWAENKAPGSPEPGSGMSALGQQVDRFAKEMVDLLKRLPNCRMAYSRFISSYHQHFHRQCRVADYGYSRLNELFDAIPHVIQVLGTGDRKVLTLTHKAQVKRFTGDLLRVLKNTTGRQLYLSTLTEEFCKLFNKNWDVIEYGVSQLDDMLSELPTTAVIMTTEGQNTVISLPKIEPSPEELERIKQFSLEIVDLLKHSHQCRMMFTKFIPAYHHHFGHQCRVSDYGYMKLQDLLEALPQVIEVDEDGEEKIIHLTESELRKVVGDQIVSLMKRWNVQCYPLDQLMSGYTQEYGYYVPLHDLHVHTPQQLMTKLKHVVKLEIYETREYVVLSDRSSAPPLARQVLQLLMDQSGGSLPLMELCSRYKTTFGIEPNTTKIKEELLDYVQVSGDDESGVISLTPLQTLARDIRVLLHSHGKISLSELERLFYEHFCVEMKPALYGFPTLVALLMAIPHVVSIKGRGNRRVVHLSGDLQGTLPIIDESYSSRPDSDTPSNDSGSALTDEDTPTESKKFHPRDLLDEGVPSGVPSPALRPDMMASPIDLIKFDFSQDYRDSIFASISEDEKTQQKTPLVQTPTSQLLQLAAQCLPPTPDQFMMDPTGAEGDTAPGATTAQSALELLRQGWWRASPSQLTEVSNSIKNAGIVEHMTELNLSEQDQPQVEMIRKGHEEPQPDINQENLPEPDSVIQNTLKDSDFRGAVQSLSATLALLRKQNELETSKSSPNKSEMSPSLNSEVKMHDIDTSDKNYEIKSASDDHKENMCKSTDIKTEKEKCTDRSFPPIGSQPLQPGSYWYSKQFQNKTAPAELPNNSTDDVRKVLASLAHPKQAAHKANQLDNERLEGNNSKELESATPQASIDISESFSGDTLTEGFPDLVAFKSEKSVGDFVSSQTQQELKTDMQKIMSKTASMMKEEAGSIIPGKSATRTAYNHKLDNCVADDCMCYEVVFRRDHPIETSSVKSDSSFAESSEGSPMKVIKQQRLSTSSLSDDSTNSSINKRRSRIAAKFAQPVE